MLAIVLKQSLQYLLGYMRRLELTAQDESVQVLEVPLLHACLSKHEKEVTEQMIDGPDANTELSCHSQCRL